MDRERGERQSIEGVRGRGKGRERGGGRKGREREKGRLYRGGERGERESLPCYITYSKKGNCNLRAFIQGIFQIPFLVVL